MTELYKLVSVIHGNVSTSEKIELTAFSLLLSTGHRVHSVALDVLLHSNRFSANIECQFP